MPPGAATTRTRKLIPAAPYNFDAVLAYLASSPSAVLEEIDPKAATYRRPLMLGDAGVLLTLQRSGTTAAPCLRLHVRGVGVDDATEAAAVAFVRRSFNLDVSPDAFLQVAAADPVLAAVVQRFDGLRPTLIATPYEALLWAIAGQQVNVSFARKLKRTLVDLCGRQLTLDGRQWPLLPLPDMVARLDPVDLLSRQFSRQKTAYLIGVSQAVAAGELDLEALALLPHEEAIAALTRHRGVGRWTAEYVLMRGLGARDSIPAADLGLRAVLGRAYGLERTATEAEVRELAERWQGWRGWAAFHWWLMLQLQLPL